MDKFSAASAQCHGSEQLPMEGSVQLKLRPAAAVSILIFHLFALDTDGGV
jgi:hypothetical protein